MSLENISPPLIINPAPLSVWGYWVLPKGNSYLPEMHLVNEGDRNHEGSTVCNSIEQFNICRI